MHESNGIKHSNLLSMIEQRQILFSCAKIIALYTHTLIIICTLELKTHIWKTIGTKTGLPSIFDAQVGAQQKESF